MKAASYGNMTEIGAFDIKSPDFKLYSSDPKPTPAKKK
jgi:hypothetical protein